jgi:hypothetical protein
LANSPDLNTKPLNAILAALEAHALMSTQTLVCDVVRNETQGRAAEPSRRMRITAPAGQQPDPLRQRT